MRTCQNSAGVISDCSYCVSNNSLLCESEVNNLEVVPRSYDDLTVDEKVVVQSLLGLGNSQSSAFVDKETQVTSGDIFVTFASTIKQETNLNSLIGLNSFKMLDSLTKLISDRYPDKKRTNCLFKIGSLWF